MTALATSNVLLWITNIALILTVLALARQIGVLNERLSSGRRPYHGSRAQGR